MGTSQIFQGDTGASSSSQLPADALISLQLPLSLCASTSSQSSQVPPEARNASDAVIKILKQMLSWLDQMLSKQDQMLKV
ncbi:hypothetical protein DY000_02018372 [Brassica cretica]|uniref:POX domain-containing protein n=1 Tax=Brassica cretica TaxID=69181 RepID=A0ABQ7CRB7_BRACR|nr:hypothetical protein DY000_02018372 [Brassica cretica]